MPAHPLRSQIGERRRASAGRQLLHAIGHRQGFADDVIERGGAGTCEAGGLPCGSQLSGDLALTGLGGIQPAGDQEQVLDGRLPRPGPQHGARLVGGRLPASQAAKDLRSAILRFGAIGHGEDQLDAITGRKIDELIYAQRSPQLGQTLRQLIARQREARNMPRAGMAVRKTDEPDLLHAPQESTGKAGKVSWNGHGP